LECTSIGMLVVLVSGDPVTRVHWDILLLQSIQCLWTARRLWRQSSKLLENYNTGGNKKVTATHHGPALLEWPQTMKREHNSVAFTKLTVCIGFFMLCHLHQQIWQVHMYGTEGWNRCDFSGTVSQIVHFKLDIVFWFGTRVRVQ
jgi:hypothetical protein